MKIMNFNIYLKMLDRKFFKKFSLVCFFTIFWGSLAAQIHAEPFYWNMVRDAHTEVRVISEALTLQPGKSFWVALQMKMEEGWHTYWKNPGDSGLATKIIWSLPENFKASEIYWPYPQRIEQPPLVSFGYENEVVLLTQIQVPQNFPYTIKRDDMPLFRLSVEWLACQVNCIPGKTELGFYLPVYDREPTKDPHYYEFFKQARERLPIVITPWEVSSWEDNNHFIVGLQKPSEDGELSNVQFFPEQGDWIDHAAVQNLKATEKRYELSLVKSSLLSDIPKRMKGVLVSQAGWGKNSLHKAWEIDIPFTPKEKIAQNANKRTSLFLMVFFAFLGGLLLNLMPCVLPVLSLKLFNLVKHPYLSKKETIEHILFFIGGILASFWALAFIVEMIKIFGHRVGWGFQFQSPIFIVFMSVFFFIFSLNLFGVFEIGYTLVALANTIKVRENLLGSFLTGILATLVATPCTAPFMGTALSVALTQGGWSSFSIFTFLGLGLAFPYLIFATFPKMLMVLPKPGKWMMVFKKILGLLLMLTVVWLVWIFSIQKGIEAMMGLIGGLGCIGIGVFILGALANIQKKSIVRWTARLVFVPLMLIGLWLPFSFEKKNNKMLVNQKNNDIFNEIQWQSFSPQLIESLRQQRKRIFIDFTAAWCLTCQVNEKIALQNKKVVEAFKKLDIIAVKADWTKRDETITKALEGFGKGSIPFYVLYGADPAEEPIFLPELLTPEIVLKALREIK